MNEVKILKKTYTYQFQILFFFKKLCRKIVLLIFIINQFKAEYYRFLEFKILYIIISSRSRAHYNFQSNNYFLYILKFRFIFIYYRHYKFIRYIINFNFLHLIFLFRLQFNFLRYHFNFKDFFFYLIYRFLLYLHLLPAFIIYFYFIFNYFISNLLIYFQKKLGRFIFNYHRYHVI